MPWELGTGGDGVWAMVTVAKLPDAFFPSVVLEATQQTEVSHIFSFG